MLCRDVPRASTHEQNGVAWEGRRPTNIKPVKLAGLGPWGLCLLLRRVQTDGPKRGPEKIACGPLHYVQAPMLAR